MQLIRTTKGRRVVGADGQSRWVGGTESAVFNELETIARSEQPRTPVLRAQMTRALNPRFVKDDVSAS